MREAPCQVSRRECGRAAAPKKLAEQIQVLSGIIAAPVAFLWFMEKK